MESESSVSWIEHALAYAEVGWPILPLHTLDDSGRCTCGAVVCKQGHSPLADSDASTDQRQIKKWAEQWPDADIAIVLPEDLLVVELARRQGGHDSVQRRSPTGGLDITPFFTIGPHHRLYVFHSAKASIESKRLEIDSGLFVHGAGSRISVPRSPQSGGTGFRRWLGSPLQYDVKPLPAWIENALPDPAPDAATDELKQGIGESAMTATGDSGDSLPEPFPNVAVKRAADDSREEPALFGHNNQGDNPENPKDSSGSDLFAPLPPGETLPFRKFTEESIARFAQGRWIAKPWLSRTGISVFTGQPKRSGKTTFLTHLISAVIGSDSFLGEICESSDVAFISDQGPETLSQTLFQAGLRDKAQLDRLHILYADKVRQRGLRELAQCVEDYADRYGIGVVIFDSIHPFLDPAPLPEQLSASSIIEPLASLASGLSVGITCSLPDPDLTIAEAVDGIGTLATVADTIAHLSVDSSAPEARRVELVSRYPDVPARFFIECVKDGIRKQAPIYPLGRQMTSDQESGRPFPSLNMRESRAQA